jgi:LmbE family N-acetylglucosaminyl deacetylase
VILNRNICKGLLIKGDIYPVLFIGLLLVFYIDVFPADSQNNVHPRKCILVFGSHADDVEEIAGGTLAKYIADGYEGVYVCVMNNFSGNQIEKIPGNWDFIKGKLTGELTGSPQMYQVDAFETSQIRSEEAIQAARVFGAVPVFMNFCEPEIWTGRKMLIYGTEEFIKFNPPARKQVSLATRYSEDVNYVVELLRKYQPGITIIHTLGGEKLDHGESAYLMYLAFKKALAQGIPVGKLWMARYGWVTDPLAERTARGKADIIIDIKKYQNIKNEAWNKHISQNGGNVKRDFLTRHPEYNKDNEEFITVIDNTK